MKKLRLISKVELSAAGDDEEWLDSLVVGKEGQPIAWLTNGEPLDAVVLDDECDMYGDELPHCRCGAPFDHGEVVWENEEGSMLCKLCAREEAVPRWYTVVWLQDRAYGGPEEGGWWYDTYELVDFKVFATKEKAAAYAPVMRAEYSNEGRRDIGSVLSGGVYRVEVWSYRPPRFMPDQKPIYC